MNKLPPMAGAGLLGDMSPSDVLLAAGRPPRIARTILESRGLTFEPWFSVVHGGLAEPATIRADDEHLK